MPKNILVAPLNWGLGHATRCIPIIKGLIACGYNPILASDGQALALLKQEFPSLQILHLPSYEIEYAKKGNHFKWKMLKNSPKMVNAILAEKKIVKNWILEHQLSGIISDNRLGVYSKKIPSVFITHQLNVLTGNTSWLSTKMHEFIIRKFTETWVPDFEKSPNLSGKLGHSKNHSYARKYIGPLSRFDKQDLPIICDILVLLSGPEPQRGILEQILNKELINSDKKVLFVKGIIEAEQKTYQAENITFYNFMNSEQLEKAIIQSEVVLCRSGYTTVMDLAKLGKNAFFIPTPGQFEQEYLAKKLKKDGLVPYSKQDDFHINNLMEVPLYKGLQINATPIDFNKLFTIFNANQ